MSSSLRLVVPDIAIAALRGTQLERPLRDFARSGFSREIGTARRTKRVGFDHNQRKS